MHGTHNGQDDEEEEEVVEEEEEGKSRAVGNSLTCCFIKFNL